MNPKMQTLDSIIDLMDERDAGPDWEACGSGRVHSGGELLFVLRVIEGKVR